MIRLIATRLVWSVPLVVIVSAFTFVLLSLTPGDAAQVILGTNTDPSAHAQVVAQLGLNKPLYQQYFDWLSQAIQGHFGVSLFNSEPVLTILRSRLEVTLSLLVGSALVSAVVGVALGLLSAVHGGRTARLIDGTTVLGMSIPTPWLGLVFVVALSVKLKIFPAVGYVSLEGSLSGWFRSLVLPVVCLSLAGIAVIAKQTRGALIDVFNREYIRALRANGASVRSIIFRHALRNASPPVVTAFGVVVIGLLGGTVVVEQLFALPGLGQAAVSAATQHDLPVMEGIVVAFTLLVVVFNLAADIAVGWLSPQVRVT